jgi:hypothetical protein
MFIVVVGDPVDGFGFNGPFPDSGAAVAWMERNRKFFDGDATIAPLEAPDEADPPAPDVIAELRGVVDYAEIINGRQHAGLEIAPVMWSKLHDLCNHAKGVIAEAEGDAPAGVATDPLRALVGKLVEEWWDCLTEEAQAQIADNASGYDAYEVANQACLDFAKLARAIGRDPSEGIEAEE